MHSDAFTFSPAHSTSKLNLSWVANLKSLSYAHQRHYRCSIQVIPIDLDCFATRIVYFCVHLLEHTDNLQFAIDGALINAMDSNFTGTAPFPFLCYLASHSFVFGLIIWRNAVRAWSNEQIYPWVGVYFFCVMYVPNIRIRVALNAATFSIVCVPSPYSQLLPCRNLESDAFVIAC